MNLRSYHIALLLRLVLVLLAFMPRSICMAAGVAGDPCCGASAACSHAGDDRDDDDCSEETADCSSGTAHRSGDDPLSHSHESSGCNLQGGGCCGSFMMASAVTVVSEPYPPFSPLSPFRQVIPSDPQAESIDHPPC